MKSYKKLVLVLLLIWVPLVGGLLLAEDESVPAAVQQPIYEGDRSEAMVSLTVNVDWGEQYLPAMMETCRVKQVPLTFFITGRWAEKHPELVKEMAGAGHEIGSHGYGHPHPDRLSIDDNLKDIRRAEDVLKCILGTSPRLFAPPYGERGTRVLKAAEIGGYKTILWSVDSLDWKHHDRSLAVQRVLGRAHNGAIVLLHPTEATAAAMPEIIEGLKDKGYTLVTVSELVSAL